jgi:enoyl-CoA hydratase
MEDEVLFNVENGVGVIILNRPKTLNALTMNMIEKMRTAFTNWMIDDDVRAVMIKGAGDRAFCAGGDVRAVRQAIIDYQGIENPQLAKDFFYEEYILNYQIHNSEKPYIALIDRVCMGGGVGLSVHGSFRIATERTVVGMPETTIGLFPDVGGAWFLSRLPGEMGTYLALTGQPVHASDCFSLGIATHLVASSSLDELEENILKLATEKISFKTIDNLLNKYSIAAEETPVMDLMPQIDACFGGDKIEQIIQNLIKQDNEFGRQTLELLKNKSPTSLKVTLEQIRRGAKARDFGETMTMEYRMSQHFAKGKDFAEGVRALLVDKDHQPSWSPRLLSEVSDEAVMNYFKPVAWRELKFS